MTGLDLYELNCYERWLNLRKFFTLAAISQKKVKKNVPKTILSSIQLKRRCLWHVLWHIFWEIGPKIEKLSEIKPPLQDPFFAVFLFKLISSVLIWRRDPSYILYLRFYFTIFTNQPWFICFQPQGNMQYIYSVGQRVICTPYR